MRFEIETSIAAPPSAVFAFHENPGVLARLTPPWERIEVVSGGDSIRVGSRAVLRQWFGRIPVRWEVEHVEYEPVTKFADIQVKGPFARWYHRHIFFDDDRGGTILRDEIEYELPLGTFGHWLAGQFVRRRLWKLFEYRHEVTRRIVESGDYPGAPAPSKPGKDGTVPGTRTESSVSLTESALPGNQADFVRGGAIP